jgi:RNA polymerase sigma-70 factor (ECF subfamily)
MNSLRRLGVREADAEDLGHEVFLAIHRYWANYDPTRPLRPWVFGIAFRVASDYRRLAYVKRESPAEPSDEIDLAPSPEARIDQERERARVIAALDAVDLDRRAVFVMHEIDGYTIPEVADALGIPTNTAYSRLRLARAEFKKAFARTERTMRAKGEPS